MSWFLFALFFLTASLAIPSAARADGDSPAVVYNRGFQWGIGPSILVPSNGGPLGAGLTLDVRYGIETGPVILAPGARGAAYFLSGFVVGEAMPTVRVTYPLGFLAPFVLGGAGIGWVSDPKKAGVALLGGGGLMIHFGRVFGLGAEITYQTITGTDFHVVSIGPEILIGFLERTRHETRRSPRVFPCSTAPWHVPRKHNPPRPPRNLLARRRPNQRPPGPC